MLSGCSLQRFLSYFSQGDDVDPVARVLIYFRQGRSPLGVPMVFRIFVLPTLFTNTGNIKKTRGH